MSGRLRLAMIPVLLAVAAGCTPSAGLTAVPSVAAPSVAAPVPLTVGLGYIPSVQFAPFYLAQRQGYYAAAGLQVSFQNKIDPDLVTLVGQGAIDIGVADGTSVIPAVSQGIPIKYIATIYGTFPNVVFAKYSAGINGAADLKGRRIGTPGKYGSSWIMLQALLGSANLTTDDVQVVEYPDFGQGAAVQQGAVDAATGFANNEPVQLSLAGVRTTVLHVDSILALPGPGLIAGTKALGTKHDAIAAFVSATLRAMREIAADPQQGLDASIAAVPDLTAGSSQDAQLAILKATIATWPNTVTPYLGTYGFLNVGGWKSSIDYMTTLKLVPKPVTVDDVLDQTILPAAGASASP